MLLLASSSLNWDEALLRLALAGVLGGLIGLERELREREAGLRTHLLVAVGSLTNAIEIEPSTCFWFEPNFAIFMMSGEIDTDVA